MIFNSCSLSTNSVIIIEPSLITISSVDKTDITCNNASNGTATLVNISGGTPSIVGDQYTYDWIDQGNGLSINQFDSIATSLDNGSYSCLILDANLCSLLTIPAIIIEPNIITADPIIQTNITCNGSGDGSATIPNINGGTPFTILQIPYLFHVNQKHYLVIF